MIKAIIFDFDGVLAESFDIKTRAFARTFEDEGEDAVKKVVAYHVANGGLSRFEKFRYIYRTILKRELTDEIFRDLCRRFEQFVVEEVVNAPSVRGADEFLKNTRGRYAMFICSGTPQDEIRMIAEKRGIAQYFSSIYGSPAGKDEIVKRIIRENGLQPGDVLYIGDAMSDYEAAVANGLVFIGRTIPGNDVLGGRCDMIADLTGLDAVIARVDMAKSGGR